MCKTQKRADISTFLLINYKKTNQKCNEMYDNSQELCDENRKKNIHFICYLLNPHWLKFTIFCTQRHFTLLSTGKQKCKLLSEQTDLSLLI